MWYVELNSNIHDPMTTVHTTTILSICCHLLDIINIRSLSLIRLWSGGVRHS